MADDGNRLLPWGGDEQEILDAARRFLDEGLRDSGSVFAPGRNAWGRRATEGLYQAFNRNPDLSGADFIVKLKGQLEESDDEVVLLAAELLSLILLPLRDWKPATKRDRIGQVLAMMDRPAGIDPQIDAAFEKGVFSGSIAFKVQIWKALATAISLIRGWWQLDDAGRSRALADPWAWRDLTESLPAPTTPAAKAELRYLRHPATFLPIISQNHRRRIRDTFATELQHPPTKDIDRDLLEITVALQHAAGGSVHFYREPLLSRWQPAAPAPTSRAWLVRGSAVSGVNVVRDWLQNGFVSLAASHLRNVTGLSADELRPAVEDDYAHLSYNQRQAKFSELNAFLHRMSPGDAILTTAEGIVYGGRIDGPPRQGGADDTRTTLRRPATWNPDGIDFVELPEALQARLKSSATVVDLTDVSELVESLLAESPETAMDVLPVETPVLPDLPADTVERLLVGKEWLSEFVDLLRTRKQVILYGPPGTGKTYLALEVASTLTDPVDVQLVQFHPAYSYEDFFEGYRPTTVGDTGRMGFVLAPGPFRKLVDQARENPGTAHILIIDEINRANLAKVFGELYFLLEYRDRPIDLMYGSGVEGHDFTLPPNVYIIGTMNTADRSIALVDAAMRRRFAFLSLHPSDPHLRGVLRSWLERASLPTEAADLLDALNSRIPDRDFAIGPSYFMRSDVANANGLDRIWRTSILPLLEELHYGDDSVDVQKHYGLATLRAATQ